MTLDAIGFGSLNLDEFREVSGEFLHSRNLIAGEEYVRDLEWFRSFYPELQEHSRLVGSDPGGSAANMIAALRRMGFRTGFCGAAGRDDVHALRVEELGEAGDLRIREVDQPSGRCLALINTDDVHRDRALIITPNANDLGGEDLPEADYFARARWLHLTSFVSDRPLAGQIKVVEGLPESVGVSFDPGAVYTSRGFGPLEPLLRRTSILFVTPEELAALVPASSPEKGVDAMLALGVETVVLKLGEQGIRGFRRSGSVHAVPPKPREIKDRTGAGDVAAAGFLAGILQGLDLEGALNVAVAAATRSIEGYGRSSYPDRSFFDKVVTQKITSGPGSGPERKA